MAFCKFLCVFCVAVCALLRFCVFLRAFFMFLHVFACFGVRLRVLAFLGCSRALWRRSGTFLGHSWDAVGAVLGRFERLLDPLGTSLGRSWGHVGPILPKN